MENNLNKEKIFIIDKPKSSIAESFKILRTNVQFALKINDPKSILVTSPGEGEGKTTISSNIAASFAKAGFKTIIVDADLRIPMQHKIFDFPNETGLSNYLNGECNYKDIIKSTQIENLDVITAGLIPPNAAELLSSKKMPELLKLLKETYNIIICDSAPINVVADTQIISPLVDGTLIVVSAGTTRKGEFKKALESLEYSNIIGVVLNVITKSVDRYYYSYHYYNYYNKYYTS